MQLLVPAERLATLTRDLLALSPEEGAAFLSVQESGERLVLRTHRVFQRSELEAGEFGELTLTEAAQLDGLSEIKRSGCGLVEVHTHPLSTRNVRFSDFDEAQLPLFARYFCNKMPGRKFGSLVIGMHGYDGRAWLGDSFEELELRPIGEKIKLPQWANSRPLNGYADHTYDRQVRALGAAGQRALSTLKVAVVGLGGTGSQVAQQLAHLGVAELMLIDDDRVEASNLPRLAGTTWWDALFHRKKSTVARRQARRLRRDIRLTTAGNLRSSNALTLLSNVDLIVGCVDNDGARLVLTELAAAHLIPYLDIGVGIDREDDRPEIGGRVAFYVPGGPCLACADELDFFEAAEDLEDTAAHAIRMVRGYARDREVEPALMPLNTVLVGLAMTEALAYVTGVRSIVPFFRYDLLGSRIVTQNVERAYDCVVCGPASGMGDAHGINRYVLC
jgi:hypothetical protein